MYNTIFAEDMGKPAVALCNHAFMTDASSAASGRGMPVVRVVGEHVPCECSVMEEIEAGIDSKVIDDIVAALTNPLTDEEQSPKSKEMEKTSGFVFKGNLEEMNRFFYKRGWSDGLPIIPPTEETVEEMLKGTDLPPDHVVTKIIPRLGKATVEKIAINAVMSGALPTYMPVLIAGVQALMEPKAGFGTTEVSTASWVPFWVINGPIRHDLNINYGSGMFSPGDIANATIGRAMGLIIKNIGGARKGIEDMGIFGNPGKYTMVAGENEEESPWEPLHVEEGYGKDESAVTVSFPTAFSFTMLDGSDPEAILRGVMKNVNRAGIMTIILNAQQAASFARDGWTKKEIAAYVSEYARVPAYRQLKGFGQRSEIEPNRMRPPLYPQDTVSIMGDPNLIRVLVAGGGGSTGICVVYAGGGTWVTQRVTKKIEFPANWRDLVKRYKNLEPNYVRY